MQISTNKIILKRENISRQTDEKQLNFDLMADLSV